MKKILITLFTLTVLCGGICIHRHDENCGYDPQTKTGCIYEEVGLLKDEGPAI